MTRAKRGERLCPQCGARYDARATYCQLDGAGLEEHEDRFIGVVLEERYEVESRLGEGGMGVVYRALDRAKERAVAIKVLHPQLSVQPEAKRRFRREARLAMTLRHPNLVRVLDFGATSEGTPYLVMEMLEGETLASRLLPRAPMRADEAMALLRPVCRAVEAAHECGVVHRDLKPENVFLARARDGSETVKVLDFGVARVLDDDETIATRTGLIFGTARYISPEGARGLPTDARSDVYSLAVITYQLLSGRLPFESLQPMNLLVAHAKEAPAELLTHESAGGVPRRLARCVMDALDKRPSRRPPSAGAYLAALEEALAEAPEGALFGRARVAGIAFALGFVAVGATGYALKQLDREDRGEVVRELLDRAERAEAEGRLEGPDGVLALTERVLSLSPAQLEARRMRDRAAARREPSAPESPRAPSGRLSISTSRPRVGRALAIEVAFDPPPPPGRVAVRVEGRGARRTLEVELSSAGRGRVSFEPTSRGTWTASLRVDGEPVGSPVSFEVAPARRAVSPPSVTTYVAPSAPARTEPADTGGTIDWSPP